MLLIDSYISKNKAFIEEAKFAGYDPYDALNGRLVRMGALGTKWGRIAATQAFRRLPVNLRPLAGIRKGCNPKALGLFLQGYCRLYSISGLQEDLSRIKHLLGLLRAYQSQGYSGACWGYNFDWQSRAAFVPKYTPTIVNSAFIGHALITCYKVTQNREALDLAFSIKDFILSDLNRKTEGETFCFSYTPEDNNYVHNANMLGASLLIRLSKIVDAPALRDPALASLWYSMKHQNDDGSWIYAETEIQKWIDSFHTGFNLEALRHFLSLNEAAEFRDAYENGVRYYADKFFLVDGTPKYYHDATYPLDIHCPTQAIAFFVAEGPEYQKLTEEILSWTLANMWDKKGFFYFRKGRFITNKIPYIRWGQAWGFRALTEYAYHKSKALTE